MKIIQLINNRLQELYKEREHLHNPNHMWIQDNGPSRKTKIMINQIKIEELENILKHKDLIREDTINLILY